MCQGDRISPCARIVPTDPPSGMPDPGELGAKACYLVRNDCELCQSLQDCGYCSTHSGMAGACNPKEVKDSCFGIGGW